jgi:hypothetical protein
MSEQLLIDSSGFVAKRTVISYRIRRLAETTCPVLLELLAEHVSVGGLKVITVK